MVFFFSFFFTIYCCCNDIPAQHPGRRRRELAVHRRLQVESTTYGRPSLYRIDREEEEKEEEEEGITKSFCKLIVIPAHTHSYTLFDYASLPLEQEE